MLNFNLSKESHLSRLNYILAADETLLRTRHVECTSLRHYVHAVRYYNGKCVLYNCVYCRVVLGAVSLVPCVIYPMMKRITYWPQAFLGKYTVHHTLSVLGSLCLCLAQPPGQ